MAKYNNQTVLALKNLLVSRLQYLVCKSKRHHTQAEIAEMLNVSPTMVSKIARGIGRGISFDALLVVAERAKLRYKLSMSYDGVGNREYALELEPVHPALRERIANRLTTLFSPILGHAN